MTQILSKINLSFILDKKEPVGNVKNVMIL